MENLSDAQSGHSHGSVEPNSYLLALPGHTRFLWSYPTSPTAERTPLSQRQDHAVEGPTAKAPPWMALLSSMSLQRLLSGHAHMLAKPALAALPDAKDSH